MSLARYALRRLVVALVLVFVVSSAALVLTRLAPGDYVSDLIVNPAISRETVAALRARYGLDQPWYRQYETWLTRAVRLDFGDSFAYGRPVRTLVAEAAANTALLAGAALALATLVGLAAGIAGGAARRMGLRRLIDMGAAFAVSVPPLLSSLLLIMIAARTGVLPVGGMTSGLEGATQAQMVWDRVRHLILPALALALPLAAAIERVQQGALRATLAEPYLLAAAARGLSRRAVIARHALRLSLRPLASVYGFIVAALLSGSFAVEIVTAWPGLGRLTYDALLSRDVFLVTGCAVAGAAFLSLGTLVSDLALALIDPRARSER